MAFVDHRSGKLRAGPFPLPGQVRMLVLAIGAMAAFLAFPAPFEQKTYAALHGLCAQRPSHSYWLGDHRLPFDARMTGIYGGFLVTSVYLAVRGRYRVFGLPTVPAILALLAGVGLMAVDGLNALLVDLGLSHPYQPRNAFRLATGLLTGLALAVTLCFLLSTTLWRRGRADVRVIGGLQELAWLWLLQVPFAALVLSGTGWLYVPVATGLLISAALVVSALALIVLTVFRRRDNSYSGIGQLDSAAAAALVVGIVVMGSIAAGRFLLERITGVQTLP